MKTDAKVQSLIDSYGSWVTNSSENCAGGTARMTKELYPYHDMFSPIQGEPRDHQESAGHGAYGQHRHVARRQAVRTTGCCSTFLHVQKAAWGLITTGLIPISHGIDHSITELGNLSYFPRIDRSRTVFSAWRDLAQGVHTYGSKMFIQLTMGLGRVGNPQCLINELKFPVSASLNPNFYIPQIPCLWLSDGKIKKIIKNAGQATADAKAAGIDGVYLHGHEGYLLEQLTNPAFNRRKLGRYADWQKVGIDLVKEIRRRGGDSYPIMYRIDLSLALNETYGEQGMSISALKKFKNGRSVEQTLDYMRNLIKAGVDMFDVDLGCYDNWWLPHPPAGMPAGCFLDVSKLVKNYFKDNNIKSNAGIEVPVVAVGKLGYPDLAEKALRDGDCDMIMLGRPLLADAEWPNKAFAGRVEDICPCIGCQEGCINEFVDGGHPQCAVNPRTGFEHTMQESLTVPAKIKHVAVVGAGPAGVLFASIAAKRGHRVELFEKSGEIGGKIIPGSVPKIKYEVANYKKYLSHVLDEAVKGGNLTVRFNTPATVESLKEQKFGQYRIRCRDKTVCSQTARH